MNPIIEFRGVKKSFEDNLVIPDFDLEIQEGEFLSIIGASGCGKTTLLKMINGLVLPDEGQILVHGEDITNKDLIELRRNIGYVIQGNILFPHLTVAQNIAFVPQLLSYSKEEIDHLVDQMLLLVNLDPSERDKYPNELSGGQQQRVGIARGLAVSPDILLMDEPFGALDAITKYQLQKELKAIQTKLGTTVVFITHDISEAIKLGTRVMVLSEGQIQQLGPSREILDRPANEYVKDLVEIALI